MYLDKDARHPGMQSRHDLQPRVQHQRTGTCLALAALEDVRDRLVGELGDGQVLIEGLTPQASERGAMLGTFSFDGDPDRVGPLSHL